MVAGESEDAVSGLGPRRGALVWRGRRPAAVDPGSNDHPERSATAASSRNVRHGAGPVRRLRESRFRGSRRKRLGWNERGPRPLPSQQARSRGVAGPLVANRTGRRSRRCHVDQLVLRGPVSRLRPVAEGGDGHRKADHLSASRCRGHPLDLRVAGNPPTRRTTGGEAAAPGGSEQPGWRSPGACHGRIGRSLGCHSSQRRPGLSRREWRLDRLWRTGGPSARHADDDVHGFQASHVVRLCPQRDRARSRRPGAHLRAARGSRDRHGDHIRWAQRKGLGGRRVRPRAARRRAVPNAERARGRGSHRDLGNGRDRRGRSLVERKQRNRPHRARRRRPGDRATRLPRALRKIRPPRWTAGNGGAAASLVDRCRGDGREALVRAHQWRREDRSEANPPQHRRAAPGADPTRQSAPWRFRSEPPMSSSTTRPRAWRFPSACASATC